MKKKVAIDVPEDMLGYLKTMLQSVRRDQLVTVRAISRDEEWGESVKDKMLASRLDFIKEIDELIHQLTEKEPQG
jgi:hypothetical protein